MSSCAKSAFTLVELLVAIALSLAIIAAATAAFAMTAKVIGRSEDLLRHNQTVREMYRACANDADYWWSLDDPFDATQQPYRTPNGGTGDGANGHPFVPIQLPGAYWNLRQDEPATWQRAGELRQVSQDDRDYALLGRIGDAEPWRAQTHVIMDRMLNQLGTYGFADYVSPTWSWWYARSSAGTNSFGVPLASFYPGEAMPLKLVQSTHLLKASGTEFTDADHYYEPPHENAGRHRWTHHGFLTTIPRPAWALGHNPTRDPLLANWAASNVVNDGTDRVRQFVNWNTERDAFYALAPHLRRRPPGWPLVRGGLLRTENAAGRAQVIDATLIDPLTGERTTYNFMIFGSSLRGARQQRDWAHWSPPATRMDQ